MVTDGVTQVLHAYRPPSLEPSPDYTTTQSDTPSLIGTDNTTPSVNSTVLVLTLQTIQKQMEIMQSMMAQMNKMTNNSHSNSTNRPKNSCAQQPRNQYQSKYCWTHGLCHHHSKDCRMKANGHKNEATVDNRMGGSSKNLTE